MSIVLKDRLDRTFSIVANNGDRIFNIINRNHIPVDAIMLRKNGVIVDDYMEIYDSNQEYVIKMVRAYHLADFLSFLNLWDYEYNQFKPEGESYYTKRINLHDNSGDYRFTQTRFNNREFVEYIEMAFVDGVNINGLIDNDDRIALGLSGGRDSLSLGYFLSRNRDKLNNFELQAVHVETSSNSLETGYAKEVSEKFGFPLRLVTNKDVKNIYNLKKSPSEVLSFVKDDYNKSYSIFTAHNFIRTCVENVAREEGINKIIYGLMKEDIVASIIKGMSIGMPFIGPVKRTYGDFTLIYPLWNISKKELTLYLEEIAKEHNYQGSPSRFERGALSRDIYYFIVDTLETINPGISYQIIEAQKIFKNNFLKTFEYKRCENCGCTYTDSYNLSSYDEEIKIDNIEGLCGLCTLLKKNNLIK